MKNQKIAKELLRMAKELLAEEYQYQYDPKHESRPAGNWEKTEKGWDKGKSDTGGGTATMEKPSKYVDSDILSLVHDYNNGSLKEDDTIELFQGLVSNGLAWKMPEKYQNKAKELIQKGLVKNVMNFND